QAQSSRRSIQSEIERALLELLGQPTRIAGAGRTDAGVHATGQVVSFACARPIEAPVIRRALNALLPRDIVVRDAVEKPETFHARFSALSRTYCYTIDRRNVRPAICRQYSYHIAASLRVGPMAEACAALVGEHDFTS